MAQFIYDYPKLLKRQKSPTHGYGVFSIVSFKKGDYIADFNGEKTSKDSTHVLWVEDPDTGTTQGWKGTGVLRFLNHSAKPNCEFQGRKLYALKRIEEGSELFIHYGEDWKEIP